MPSRQPSTEAVPQIPLKIVQYLDELYRDEMPEVRYKDISEIAFDAGQVDVVRHLRHLYEQQTGEEYVQRERAKRAAPEGGRSSRSTAGTG